jgi:hypothetical protein
MCDQQLKVFQHRALFGPAVSSFFKEVFGADNLGSGKM